MIITKIVSRPIGLQNIEEFRLAGRLSAASAFPQSIAKNIRNSRSITTFKALSDGLKTRGITVSKRKMEVWTQNPQFYPQKQKRPSDQEERF